jgi:hypothetical protein
MFSSNLFIFFPRIHLLYDLKQEEINLHKKIPDGFIGKVFRKNLLKDYIWAQHLNINLL